VHDQDALDSIADMMNNRPRQTLGWKSPYQAFQQFMQAIAQRQDATIHWISIEPFQQLVLRFGFEIANLVVTVVIWEIDWYVLSWPL